MRKKLPKQPILAPKKGRESNTLLRRNPQTPILLPSFDFSPPTRFNPPLTRSAVPELTGPALVKHRKVH